MKKILTICLAFMWCISAQVRAQNDSTLCNSWVSYTHSTNANGVTTFTGVSNESSPHSLWWFGPEGFLGSGATYSGTIPSGTEICVQLKVYTQYYDSLLETSYWDSCYAYYCDTWYADTLPVGNCNAQVSYTYVNNPNGSTTFTAQYSGVPWNADVVWFDQSSPYPVAVGSTWTTNVTNGETICAEVTGFSTYYDSLQMPYTDTCSATYCEAVYTDTVPLCNAQVSYTYVNNPNGSTTFTAQYSGVPWNADVVWFDQSSPYPVAVGSTWTTNVTNGETICAEVTGFSTYYDSLQLPYTDTCSATYCEVVYTNTVPVCDVELSYTHTTNANGVTTFTAVSSDILSNVFWFGPDGFLGSGVSYSGTVQSGTEICAQLKIYTERYDSLLETSYWDSCYAYHCEIWYADTLPVGNCNAQVSYTYVNNPNGSTTFTAQYSGVPWNADVVWFDQSSPYPVAVGSTWTTNVTNGETICAEVTGFSTYYDSLQLPYTDTCSATYCETIYTDTLPEPVGCNAEISFTHSTDQYGVTTFTAVYSGVINPTIEWFGANGSLGYGPTYTATVASGSEICAVLTGFWYYYDSIQQITVWDSCYAQSCGFFYGDTLPVGCAATFDYYSDSLGVTYFTGNYTGGNPASMQWFVNGNYVGSGSTYSGPALIGSDMCFVVYGTSDYYDSIYGPGADTCFAQFCQEVQELTLGVSEQEISITAFPNPAKGVVSLKISGETRIQSVSITDMYGRQVVRSVQTTDIDLSQLSAGMYMIRALDLSGNCLWSDQLIKQ